MPSDIISFDSYFKCRKCGECCKGYGGTYLNQTDINRISRYINSDPIKFADNYCNLSGNKPVLAQQEDGHCIFWDQICTIHPVKPLMCRKWPFLESILIDSTNWLIMANSCPGIQTDVDIVNVKKIVRLMRMNNWNVQQ